MMNPAYSHISEPGIAWIVFDWGGVIQRTLDTCPRLGLDAELGLPPGSVERAVFDSSVWEQASRGLVSGDAAWSKIAASLGIALDGIEDFVSRFFGGDEIDAVLVSLIKDLRADGYPVGLLSNAPPGRSASTDASARWGIEGLFDVQVFSYQVGALKPDPRMYRRVLADLSAEPTRTLFIDDSPANIEGARKIGIQSILFTGRQDLLESLPKLGIRPPARNDESSRDMATSRF